MNELKIIPPEGMEIDKANSTFECIKFKPKRIYNTRDIKGRYSVSTTPCFNSLKDAEWVKAACMLRALWREWTKYDDTFDTCYSIVKYEGVLQVVDSYADGLWSWLQFQDEETANEFLKYFKLQLETFFTFY